MIIAKNELFSRENELLAVGERRGGGDGSSGGMNKHLASGRDSPTPQLEKLRNCPWPILGAHSSTGILTVLTNHCHALGNT